MVVLHQSFLVCDRARDAEQVVSAITRPQSSKRSCNELRAWCVISPGRCAGPGSRNRAGTAMKSPRVPVRRCTRLAEGSDVSLGRQSGPPIWAFLRAGRGARHRDAGPPQIEHASLEANVLSAPLTGRLRAQHPKRLATLELPAESVAGSCGERGRVRLEHGHARPHNSPAHQWSAAVASTSRPYAGGSAPTLGHPPELPPRLTAERNKNSSRGVDAVARADQLGRTRLSSTVAVDGRVDRTATPDRRCGGAGPWLSETVGGRTDFVRSRWLLAWGSPPAAKRPRLPIRAPAPSALFGSSSPIQRSR